MHQNFGPQIAAALAVEPVTLLTLDHVCAIAAKESAIYWIGFVDRLKAQDILPLCVFDASGDFPGTSRGAFPPNAAAMRADPDCADLVDPLIAAANTSRRILHGWGSAQFLYKGYGLFQYDLQNVRRNVTERAFFAEQKWGSFDECVSRLMSEMREKLRATDGNLDRAIVAYNGSGLGAERYGASVEVLRERCAAVTV